MAQPYLGEIRLFGSPNAPAGWAPCDGRTLDIRSYPDLFALLGETYGRTRTTFNLPDLRGRAMLGVSGSAHPLGQAGGQESVALKRRFFTHSHRLQGTDAPGATLDPSGALLANVANANYYAYVDEKAVTMYETLEGDALSTAGGSGAHENMQPSLALNFCIALTGANPVAE